MEENYAKNEDFRINKEKKNFFLLYLEDLKRHLFFKADYWSNKQYEMGEEIFNKANKAFRNNSLII